MAYKTDKKIVTQKVKKYIKLMQENGFDIWRREHYRFVNDLGCCCLEKSMHDKKMLDI